MCVRVFSTPLFMQLLFSLFYVLSVNVLPFLFLYFSNCFFVLPYYKLEKGGKNSFETKIVFDSYTQIKLQLTAMLAVKLVKEGFCEFNLFFLPS